ncbi:TatD family hydrolase [Candidatus Woesebacteria bacterium]|nr:MAG: TatD family hydrolase [Candidatus Woesebacteria bacterium]
MFDTHCHLNSDEFVHDLKTVINNARDSGVKRFLVPGLDLESSRKAVEIVENFKGVYAAIGIHPTQDLENINITDALYKLTDLANSNVKVVAIGEVGLDYFRYQAGEFMQKEFFVSQIKLATKLNKALIIHNRHATDDIIKSIESVGSNSINGRAVFHCCPPEKDVLEYAIANNIFIGVDGDVTYDDTKKEFVKDIPLDLLVLETDSPYLTPYPTRSVKKYPNEPANLKYIAQCVGEIKNINSDDLVHICTSNANKLFDLD